jgi:indolepyruvate ferredoxin oxidoreductase beta subunit
MKGNNKDVTNFVLVGVGGQGIILASTIVSEAAVLAGHDVKNNEVHGMAQRGGSVVSQIRFGPKVYSPLIKKKSAHFVISLEKLETLRYSHLYNAETRMVVNDLKITPVTVTSGNSEYPADIDKYLTETFQYVTIINANHIAEEAGNLKAANVVIIGAMSNFLPFGDDIFEAAIRNSVKKNYVDLNIEAFYRGKEAACSTQAADRAK